MAIVRAAIAGVSARTAVSRALHASTLSQFFSRPVHVIAAGKAASAMITALAANPQVDAQSLLAIGTHRETDMPAHVEWRESAHPVPDQRSLEAGTRALEVAAAVRQNECLLLLLSGGASSLMALPIDGLALHDKQDAIRRLMLRGADIHALNTVRKHLSGVKGGRLAAACSGTTLTLAISDVVGDDVSVIGSGPGVPDTTTWRQVAAIVERFGPASAALRVFIEHGLAGRIAETPKPGDAAMRRVHAHVIASRRHALAAARAHAETLGYHVTVLEGDVTGESRDAARPWLRKALIASADLPVPRCVLSAGETTVRVSGGGRGGRNQEFALAVSRELRTVRDDVLAASVGTDGIDGPTDAAGAMADRTTIARGEALGLDWSAFLDDNNAYDFFASLGDLIHLGRTDTNVGDVQVLLRGGQ